MKIVFNPPIRPTSNVERSVSNIENMVACVLILVCLAAGLFLYGVV